MNAFPHVRCAARSDVGRVRANNEDAFGVFPDSGIYCVADGMGGGDDGEVASAMTVEAIRRFTNENPLPETEAYPIDGVLAGICRAVNGASSQIELRAREAGLRGCGSTFVGLCLDAAHPARAVTLHAGDSRAYRIRGKTARQMTTDHSFAEFMGAQSERELSSALRGVILRAVGVQDTVELERTVVPVQAGDRILLCSDGLSRMLDDHAIGELSASDFPLEESVDRLIDAANAAGGIDNITAVLIAFGELPGPLPLLSSSPDAPASPKEGMVTVEAPPPEVGTPSRPSWRPLWRNVRKRSPVIGLWLLWGTIASLVLAGLLIFLHKRANHQRIEIIESAEYAEHLRLQNCSYQEAAAQRSERENARVRAEEERTVR